MAAAISGNGDQRGEERAVSQAMRPLRDDANSKVWMVKWACESKKSGVSRRKEERWRARGVPIQRAQPLGEEQSGGRAGEDCPGQAGQEGAQEHEQSAGRGHSVPAAVPMSERDTPDSAEGVMAQGRVPPRGAEVTH